MITQRSYSALGVFVVGLIMFIVFGLFWSDTFATVGWIGLAGMLFGMILFAFVRAREGGSPMATVLWLSIVATVLIIGIYWFKAEWIDPILN